MHKAELKQLIERGMQSVDLVDVMGDDGVHFEAVVVSDDFAGKSMLQQHRLVYAALGDSFATEAVHALSLRTYTPEQWQARGGA